jgi:hypothetical protein
MRALREETRVSKDFEADRDAFHSHLDECRRCREEPFNLCARGAKLLKTAVERPRYQAPANVSGKNG